MTRGSMLVVVFALAALAGCRSQPYVNAHIETLNAEYRQLEDYVYALEEENARLCQELEPLKGAGGTASPASRGGILQRSSPSLAPPARRGSGAAESSAPAIEIPPATDAPGNPPASRSRLQRPELEAPADTPPDLSAPLVEIPPAAAAGDAPSAPSETPPAADAQPLLPPPPGGSKSPELLPKQPADGKVTHLFLDPARSGGTDLDGQPGDDGLRLVLEPRNASDEYVPEARPVSIVVLDPSRDGQAARVARWDFDLSAAREMLAASGGRGLKLELPWLATPPASQRLQVYVRYETADGRRLQTDREIFVTPPGQAIGRWTPRTESKRSAAAVKSEPALSPVATTAAKEPVTPPVWSPNREY